MNADFLKYLDNVDKTKRLWSDYVIVGTIAEQIYSLTNGNPPENPTSIVSGFLERFRKAENVMRLGKNHYAYSGNLYDLMDMIEAILFDIDSFKRLNLTPEERANNVDPDDDKTRAQYSVAGKKFVNLGDFIQNVWYYLNQKATYESLFEEPYFSVNATD